MFLEIRHAMLFRLGVVGAGGGRLTCVAEIEFFILLHNGFLTTPISPKNELV